MPKAKEQEKKLKGKDKKAELETEEAGEVLDATTDKKGKKKKQKNKEEKVGSRGVKDEKKEEVVENGDKAEKENPEKEASDNGEGQENGNQTTSDESGEEESVEGGDKEDEKSDNEDEGEDNEDKKKTKDKKSGDGEEKEDGFKHTDKKGGQDDPNYKTVDQTTPGEDQNYKNRQKELGDNAGSFAEGENAGEGFSQNSKKERTQGELSAQNEKTDPNNQISGGRTDKPEVSNSGGASAKNGGTEGTAGKAMQTAQNIGNMSISADLISPDAVVNLIIAAIFTALCLIPAINIVVNIFAVIYFTMWMIATNKKGWWMLLVAIILGFIPFVSDVATALGIFAFILGMKLPTCWITFVYSML